MDALQAAILRVKAPHLPAWTEARRVNASRYVRLFQERGLGGRLVLPVEPAHRRHIFNQFTIRVSERDRLKAHLDRMGIGSEIYYPVPLHRQPCFADRGYQVDRFPSADAAARECLSIPIYAELSVAQQQTVVDAIAGCLLDA
jgi:dTDP-4-amino-4,6-dideoxygalactose transaminase